MLTQRLASLFQIRPGEGLLVVLVASLFALTDAGRGLGANAADALFFRRFGVEFLPYMFMLLGAANFAVALLYAAGLGRFDKRRFFAALIAVLAIIVLVERAAIVLDLPVLYPVLWISVSMIGSILGLLAWNVAGEVCDARQAKRLFSLFVSAAILGGVAGNFVTGPLAQAAGTENLLLLYASLLLACAVLTRQIARRFFRPAARRAAGASFVDEVRAGFDYVRRSPLLTLMAFSAVLFSILYFSISFPFSKAVSGAFPDEAAIAGFLGVFSGIATAITFGVSLFAANRLYARIGVVNAVLLLPITYLVGFVLFTANYSLTTAVIARLAQLVVLGGIAGTAYSTFFNVVPSEKRGQVRSFDSGVPEQIGVALSGVLLILGERVLTPAPDGGNRGPAQIFVFGMIVALACGFLVWRMRRRYGEALVDALRAGRFEVFSAGERAFAGFQGDANAIRVAVGALRDARPATRRLAIELLSRMNARSAVGDLLSMLKDPSADVRAAAIRALDFLDAQEATNALVVALGDPDASVRAEALRALPHLQLEVPPTVLAAVGTLLRDPDLNVRAQAAVALAKFGAADRALPTLDAWLHDADPHVRVVALDALSDIATGFDVKPVIHALSDRSAPVRRAACHVLALARAEAAIDPLVTCLGDPDPSVQGAAAAALQAFGAKATPRVLAVLHGEDGRAVDAALDVLWPPIDSVGGWPDDPVLHDALIDYAQREIAQAREWRDLVAAMPKSGRVTKLLCETLEARAARSEQRLVKAVGLLGNPAAMEQVGKSLKTRDPQARAAAIEALETLGHRHLARQIIPLLDDAPPSSRPPIASVGGRQPVDAAIRSLLASQDGWLRALAASAAGELQVRDVRADLHMLESDPDPLAREAARVALSQLKDGEPMETLQTVSTMERILWLREVPLFVELTPDDLKQVADIAGERWYGDGALLCRYGEEGNELFVLVSGRVDVYKEEPDGAEKYLATREAGDFIGEMAILDPGPRSASVRAEGEVRALVIEGEAFNAILRDRSEVSLALLRALSRRLRERE